MRHATARSADQEGEAGRPSRVVHELGDGGATSGDVGALDDGAHVRVDQAGGQHRPALGAEGGQEVGVGGDELA
jgi:hypothetical protein